uniref:Uncharacterized protein n=1 Tax=Salix viminalis TaxID=40686 RepID=A0A6N2M7Q9_SALVM
MVLVCDKNKRFNVLYIGDFCSDSLPTWAGSLVQIIKGQIHLKSLNLICIADVTKNKCVLVLRFLNDRSVLQVHLYGEKK